MKNWFRRQPATETRALDAEMYPWLMMLPTASGIQVTPQVALRCSAANGCIRLISSVLGDLPVHAMQRQEDGGRERLRDHPADRLLNDFAAPWLHGRELRREVTLAALLHGRGYALAVRAGGEIRELHMLPSHAVTVDVDEWTGEPTYKVALKAGGTREVSWRDMVDVKALGGQSPTMLAREAIGLALELEKHGSKLWANGGRPSGVLKFAKQMSDAALERVRAAWQSAHGGDNSGRTAILEGGAEFDPIALTSTDSQYLENRRHQVTEIARFYGISPIMLGVLEGSTFNNSEAAGRQLLTYCVQGWLTAWANALSRVLLTEDERASGIYLTFKTEAITAADIKSLYESLRQAVGGPIMTPADARNALDLPFLQGSENLYPPQGTNAPAQASKDNGNE